MKKNIYLICFLYFLDNYLSMLVLTIVGFILGRIYAFGYPNPHANDLMFNFYPLWNRYFLTVVLVYPLIVSLVWTPIDIVLDKQRNDRIRKEAVQSVMDTQTS